MNGVINTKDRDFLREAIGTLQTAMFSLPETEHLDLPPVHHWSKGIYARELLIPKDSVVVGKIHKHPHLNVILRGKVRVVTPYGTDTIEGPCIFESKPDTKRAVYAIEETVWITFHPTDKQTVDEVEQDIILPDYSDKLALIEDNKEVGDTE